MKTLHLYLTREILLALVMTVAVFTFVLLLGNILKEIIALLMARQISIGLVLKAIGLLLPYAVVYVLPFGMLTAVLLVFGRFSADQELTAVRANGVSLLSVVTPIIGLSLVACCICAIFNLWVGPRCRTAYKNLVFELLGSRNISNLITEDRFIDEIPGIVLYVRKKSGNEIEDIRLYNLEDNRITARTIAKRGLIKFDPATQKIGFELFDVITETRWEPKAIDENFIGPPEAHDPTQWRPIHFGEAEPEFDLAPLARAEHKPKLSEMDFWRLKEELINLREKGISVMPVKVQMHRQIAFSFACFAFTLLAIPLAIQAHRRETSIGVAIALALILLYYTFIITAQALQTKEQIKPHLIVWLPNFIFQGLGGWLLYRANRR